MRVPEEIRQSASAQAAAAVHGIADDEIALGAAFPTSWARFLAFVDLNNLYLLTTLPVGRWFEWPGPDEASRVL